MICKALEISGISSFPESQGNQKENIFVHRYKTHRTRSQDIRKQGRRIAAVDDHRSIPQEIEINRTRKTPPSYANTVSDAI